MLVEASFYRLKQPELSHLSENSVGPDTIIQVRAICCLVEKRYEPTQKAWTEAEEERTKIDNQIKGYKAQLENWTKSFEKNSKGAILRYKLGSHLVSCIAGLLNFIACPASF